MARAQHNPRSPRGRQLKSVGSIPIVDNNNNNDKSARAPSLSSTIVRGLRKAQKYSAYSFSIFGAMHAFTVVIAPCISNDLANASLMLTRTFYQDFIGEAALVWGSLAVHITSGLLLHARRVYMHYRYYDKLELGLNPVITSGLVLTGLVMAHATINRIAPILVSGDSSLISLDYISWSLAHSAYSTAAALILLTTTYAYHSVSGFRKYKHMRFASSTVVSGVLGVIASFAIYSLSKRQIPAGWLASQFAMIHDAGMKLLMPF